VSIQTSNENGDKNRNESLNLGGDGPLIIMLIPRFRKGSEKSMALSLCELIVKPATAKSAFFFG
jgi:hypothetical protein